MPTYYEYAVTSKSGVNISEIEQYLEKDTITETKAAVVASIPTRIVTSSYRNSLSYRTTYYQLTEDEARSLQNYPDVLGVELVSGSFEDSHNNDANDGVLVTGSINHINNNFIPALRPHYLITPNNTGSVSNPALILHSFPSSSNILEYIYNTINNISSPNTPGTGNDNFFNYKSSKTGKNVDLFFSDGFPLRNHAEFFNKDGSPKISLKYTNFITKDLIPRDNNRRHFFYIRRSYCWPAHTSLHGTHCHSLAYGENYGNAIDCNPQPAYGTPTSGTPYDMIRHYHVSKSINPYTGYKDPTIWGRSSGYIPQPLLHTDFLIPGGIVSGSFNFSDAVSGVGQGIRINYENIDYFILSSSVNSNNFNTRYIGDSPIPHKIYYIDSNDIGTWASKLNTAFNFLEVNYSSNNLQLTSSENINWYITVYKGSQASLESNGGDLILTLSGSELDNTKPYFAISEWAPLGTPIGLPNKYSKYAAPRADYFLPSPNADYHGIDNGYNMPFGASSTYYNIKIPAIDSQDIAIRAAQEEASKAGVILASSYGNDPYMAMYTSCSSEDEFHRNSFDMDITVTNPLNGNSINGHPYNSYFIISEDIYYPTPPYSRKFIAGKKIYYQRYRDHHSVIGVGNISIVKSSSAYLNKIECNTGNALDIHLYGNYTIAATTVTENYGSITGSSVFSYGPTNFYNNDDNFYDINSLYNSLTEFTASYNNLWEQGIYPDGNNLYGSDRYYKPITSSFTAALNESGSLYYTWPGAKAGLNYRPNGNSGNDDPRTFGIERGCSGFSGTSASSPLLVGFIAGYLEENPQANTNDVRNWLEQNSIKTIITGSNNIVNTHFDGFYYKSKNNNINPDGIYRFISSSTDTRKEGLIQYIPFTSTNVFKYPYTDLSIQLAKYKNIKLT